MSSLFKQLSDSMADAVAAVSPSIVRVEARRRLAATGIAWSAEIVVTANHVVEYENNLFVGLHDGTRASAQLVGRDPMNDLAVLRVPGGAMQPAAWGDEAALRVGQLVLAIGRPMESLQASLGVVSGLMPGMRRKEEAPKKGRRRMGQALADGYIQTDVIMYPGFSGGPLLGGDGLFYGLNTSGFRSDTSISVPVTTIRNTIVTLLAHGKMKQGYLGVAVQAVRLPEPIAQQINQEVGLLVTNVEKGSPAEMGGVLVGDILTALDGQAMETVDELLLALHSERIGQRVTLDVVRGGQLMRLEVTVAERV